MIVASIRIFVSRRLDVPSCDVPNSLYQPIVCGGVFSKKPLCNGDDRGNNISSKRNSYCEFTVAYWAWKNTSYTYYGLCHYRRYLSFSLVRYHANSQAQVLEPMLTKRAMEKYGLLDEKHMEQIISQYDLIVNETADVREIPTPRGVQDTVYDHWCAHDGMFLDARALPIFLDVIHLLFPEYEASAMEYLRGHKHRGYNCFIMKREIFDAFCRFTFSVLDETVRRLEGTGYLERFERTPGYLGEILYGIFVHHLRKQRRYKIKELQLVYFEQTVIPSDPLRYYIDYFLAWSKIHFEGLGYFLLPKNSRRRRFIKKIYFRLIGR